MVKSILLTFVQNGGTEVVVPSCFHTTMPFVATEPAFNLRKDNCVINM